MRRRRFLQGAAAAGGMAALRGALPGWPELEARALGTEGSILDLSAKESPITHIVVLMMENRSVDHYLGWLGTDEAYLEEGRSRYGPDFAFDGDNQQQFSDPTGAVFATYHLPTRFGHDDGAAYRGCEHRDPGHGWNAGRAQRDGGFLAEDSGNDEFAIGYYVAADRPLYAHLARRFTTFDRYHCSVLGPTFPNREYLHSAQSGGIKDNRIPFETLGFQWSTIWDRLIAARVPAGYYFVDLPTTGLWGPRLLPITHHLERYLLEAAVGTLPNVTFVDPGFTTGFRTDEHPHGDIRAGQAYVTEVIRAFIDSPLWAHGVLIITYDEWGGFFDHVPPPLLPDDRASETDTENFGQAGFRVPTLVLSPYARRGFVDHNVYDHTSILRFIEWRFLGAPAEGPGSDGDRWFLTSRDRHAGNIGRSLRPNRPHPELDFELALRVPVTSLPCRGEELEGLPLPDLPVATTPPDPTATPDAFAAALDSGYFELAGYRTDLAPPAELRLPKEQGWPH